MKRIAKWFFYLALGTIVLSALTGLGGYVWLRGSLPRIQGAVTVSGPSATIEIVRDRHGIPHIHAVSETDAMFGLGYVHAQDRLWQMEMNRRTGAGRLSEVLGLPALSADKFLRTLGLYRVVERALPTYAPEVRDGLGAYAAGVNAYLETHEGPLPPEFVILGHTPEPWRPEDSLVWIKMMAWELGQNFREELARAQLATRLSPQQISEFLPPYPGDAPALIDDLPDLADLYAKVGLDRIAAALPEGPPAGIGSNNWVVDGSRTASGKPLLANDPHLGLAAPSVWYFAHLSFAGRNVIGASLPGVPAIVLGRNDHIAWGFTDTGPDVQDLYIETIDPKNPDQYLTPDGAQKFLTRKEIIRVKDADPVVITVRQSRHGPVISDVAKFGAMDDAVLALAWTALLPGDQTPAAVTKLMAARDWDDFVDALRDYHLPQQNIVYADVDGNIGYYAPGKVPVRRKTNALLGLAPAPGQDENYDWTGFIPFSQLPQRYNPAGGAIVTANQKIVADDYPHFITSGWQKPYRARRIRELLAATKTHSIESFKAIQADVVSVVARDVLPLMLELTPSDQGGHPQFTEALSRLEKWDGAMTADTPEPLIFVAWYRELTRRIYRDELGNLFPGLWKMRPSFIHNVLRDTGGQSRWCNDVGTERMENCASQLVAALDMALQETQSEYGQDLAGWRWGQAHIAYSEHRPFGAHRWLSKLFDIAVPSPGGSYTVNVGVHRIRSDQPFRSTHSVSLRAIYDLSDLDNSIFIHSTGQSGNPLSPLYDNFTESWGRGAYVPMTTDRAEYSKAALGTLILHPRQGERQ